MSNTAISSVPRISSQAQVSVVPTITANSAYTSGFQVGGLITLANVVRIDSSTGIGSAALGGITILDTDKQNSLFDVWFFNASPTIASSDHAAFNMTAANAAASCIGVVSVGGFYSASSSSSVSSDPNINLLVHSATDSNIYAVLITRSTPTYTTTTSLKLWFKFLVD